MNENLRKFEEQLEVFNNQIKTVKNFITKNGEIKSRIETEKLEGKWLETANDLNSILDYSSKHLDEIISVINNVAMGNLNEKMRLKIDKFEFKGNFLYLAETINTMVDQLSQFASEVTRVAKEVGTDGILGGQAKVEGVSGTWLDLTNNVNAMADALTGQVRNIANVTTAVAQGDLSQRITVDAKGEVLELKDTINTMVDQLSQFASEVTRVAKEVGTYGLLGGQAEVEGVSGTWLNLTNNVNSMANSLTAQVRNIADVTTAVAKGDLSQKITVDAKGEVLELKRTINTMVDQLSQFASEVTRVAKEVGTDGLLGVQAKVDGVSGTWLDLTNNINAMSKSLEKVDVENKSQNWIKDGISALSKEILQKDNLSEQTNIAINHLSRYINAGMGVLYLYNSTDETLKLDASFAYTESKELSKEFRLCEGIVGQVACDKKPILLSSASDALLIKTATTEYKHLNTYTSPLVFEDKLVGVAELASYHPFTQLQIEYIESALSVLAGSFYISLQVRDKERLQHISITDALTGTYNRGYFDEIMPQIINSKKRSDSLVSFAILDIDYFKNFNDTYGHHMGDEVLKQVAKVLKNNALRDDDLCFRVGGEEFAMIFSANDENKAYDYMFKIKEQVENLIIKNDKNEILNKVTISIGLTCKRASEISDIKTLYKQTDELLYKAKEGGRNMVVKNESV